VRKKLTNSENKSGKYKASPLYIYREERRGDVNID